MTRTAKFLGVLLCTLVLLFTTAQRYAWDDLNQLLKTAHTWPGTQTFNTIAFSDGTTQTTAGSGNPNISETGASAYVTGDRGRASGTTQFAVGSVGVADVVVKGDGKVGIGTTGPDETLVVAKAAANNYIKIDSPNSAGLILDRNTTNSSSAILLKTAGVQDWYVGTIAIDASKDFLIGTADTSSHFLIQQDGKVGIGTTSPGEKLSVIGGVSIGQVDPMSGTSLFMAIASGASPEGVPVNGIQIYSVSGDAWVASANGTNTQISPHDPVTGEVYINSFNSYTGKGLKYYPVSGNSEVYTVPIYDWEADQIAKQKAEFVKAYQAANTTEEVITKDFTETYDETEKVKIGEATKYKFDDGKVVPYTEPIYEDQVKQKTKLKTNHRIDKDTGKVFKKTILTQADAIAAFDPNSPALLADRRAKWDTLAPFLKAAISRPK